MGNVINKDNDTINWNNVKTEKFSESNGALFLSDDSKLLASRLVLNIPEVEPSESEHLDIEKIFNKYQVVSGNQKDGSELSDTSPFISSEMYKYLMNKNQINEVKVGGGLKQKGGAIEEDSSTSSTSSSEEIGTKGKHNNKEHKKQKKEAHKKEGEKAEDKGEEEAKEEEEEEEVEESELESSGGASDNLSYISSSAHEGEDSEKSSNPQQSEENSNESTSEVNSTESVSNGNNQIPPSSINTSDINMISE